MSKSVTVNNMTEAIMKELEFYANSTTEMLKAEVKQVTKECKEDVKKNIESMSVGSKGFAHTGLVKTGKYRDSWGYTKNYEGRRDIRYTVHAKKGGEYRLTHLLEKGHIKVLWGVRTNGRVRAYPHIAPAEQEAEKKLLNRVKVRIQTNDYQ